jgi:hypothetical protein
MKKTKPDTRDLKPAIRLTASRRRAHSSQPSHPSHPSHPKSPLSAESRGVPANVSPALATKIEQLLAQALTLEKYAVEEGRITVNAISLALGTSPSSMHYAMNELRLETQLERRRRGAGRRAHSITFADSKILLAYLLAPRKRVRKNASASQPPGRPQFGLGYFYIVLLEPQLDSGRFKAGYTRCLKQRLTNFRTCLPFGEYLFHWPCQRAWELTARAYITRDCKHLREEVYRTRDIPSLLARAAQFFVEMPDPRPSSSATPISRSNKCG